MGFKSLFPFFNRTELAPSEPDLNPDIDSKFGRVVARLEAASNIQEVFNFVRSDYNGRIHVNDTPTDFNNFSNGTYLTIVGTSQLRAANPDRQEILIVNSAGFDVTIYLVLGGVDVLLSGLSAGELVEIRGFTQAIRIGSSTAGGTLYFFEI